MNPFDQFDETPKYTEGVNPFDQFDAPINSVVNQQEPQGFIGNVSADIKQRAANIQGIRETYGDDFLRSKSPVLANIVSGTQQAGQIVGGVLDIGGQAISSLAKTGFEQLSPENQEIARLAGRDIRWSGLGQGVVEAGKTVGDYWGAFKDKNPTVAATLESVGNIGGLVPASIATRAAVPAVTVAGKVPFQVAGKVAQGSGEIGLDILGIEKKIPIPTAIEMGKISTGEYEAFRKEVGVLPPEFINKFIEDAQTIRPQTEKGLATRGETPATKDLQVISTFRDKPTTMAEIDELDKEYTRKVTELTDGGIATPNSRDMQQIQNKFRAAIDEYDMPGVASWKDAKNSFATSRRLKDIENIHEYAKNRPNEAVAIQAGYRRMAEDEGLMRGYSPEAQALIKKVAKNNDTVDVLKMAGNRLLTLIVAGAGGGVGATAATAAGGMATRGLAAKMKIGQSQKVEQQIMKDYATKQKQNNLSVERRGNAIDTGLTPDVRRAQINNQVNQAYEQLGLERDAIKEAQIVKLIERTNTPLDMLINLKAEQIDELAKFAGKSGELTAYAKALRFAARKKGDK